MERGGSFYDVSSSFSKSSEFEKYPKSELKRNTCDTRQLEILISIEELLIVSMKYHRKAPRHFNKNRINSSFVATDPVKSPFSHL